MWFVHIITVTVGLVSFIGSPVITNLPNDMEAIQGKAVNFTCSADSEPLHTTLWLFRGNELSNSNKHQISEMTLTIFDLTLDDAGTYSCLVLNTHGNASASATLKVQGLTKN